MAKKNNGNNGGTELAAYGDTSALQGFGTVGAEDLAALLAGAEILPQVVSLDEEGKFLDGVMEGPGQVVDYKDPTGDERELNTWRFKLAGGVKVDVIGSYQLNKSLPDLIGHRVVVVKGPTKKVGAKQVNQYIIADKGRVAP